MSAPNIRTSPLYERLLDAEPREVPVICNRLMPHKDDLLEQLWTVVKSPGKSMKDRRLRAASALAEYDPENEGWAKVAEPVVNDLVRVPTADLAVWKKFLRPVRDKLLLPLAMVFRNDEETERYQATEILADYAAENPDVLAELIKWADPDLVRAADARQYDVLFPVLEKHREKIIASMNEELHKTPQADGKAPTEVAKEELAKRQARAAATLLRLGQPEEVWRCLQFQPDPRLRTYLIHGLSPLGADPLALAQRLEVESDVTARRALILCLGEFKEDKLPQAARQPLIDKLKLLKVYRDDPDPGVHSAVDWLLRHWGQSAELQKIDRQLVSKLPTGKRQWYVNSQVQTLAVIPPGEFSIGSPDDEPNRDPEEEMRRARIPRSFAIATKEVTAKEFERFEKENPTVRHTAPKSFRRLDPDGPIVGVTWFQAVQYCRWLSDKEEIEEDQKCYPPMADIKEGMQLPADFLARTGYRLPTEEEWEYACRARTITSRSFGGAEEMLGHYAWYNHNSKGRAQPVGQLKPNDFGLFDMYGNAEEWCQDRASGGDHGASNDRAIRGGAFYTVPTRLRSAAVVTVLPSLGYGSYGLRIARTQR